MERYVKNYEINVSRFERTNRNFGKITRPSLTKDI